MLLDGGYIMDTGRVLDALKATRRAMIRNHEIQARADA